MKRLGSKVLAIGVAIVGMSVIAALAQSGDEPKTKKLTASRPALPECPVTGKAINLAVSTSTGDGPVFFCCSGCIKKFEAEPKKFADKVAVQRKALAKLPRVQVTCPISGEPVKSEMFVEEKGGKVYFCCRTCRGKYENDPAKYAPGLVNTFTYQTKCPVSGKEIDPLVSANAPTGETIYFCCKDCPEKFRKDPAQFAGKLEEQGFRLDLAPKKG